MSPTTMEPSPRLILFDIDGTLITSGGAGERALIEAMESRFGVDEDFSGIQLAGATDGSIARNLLEKNGLASSPENIADLLDGYLGHLAARIHQHKGTLLPGIVPLLEDLRDRPDAVLALLTGNIRRGAEIKLGHYGVWHFFEFGAFADDHHDRNELGHFARRRAQERHGSDFPPDHIFVLGDTPRDIECGRAIGAKTVAIATGQYSVDALAEHHPDHLFADLTDKAAVIAALFSEP